MTELSYPWDGIVTGDASLAPYNSDVWSDMWRKLFCSDRQDQGYIAGYANELAPSGTVSPITIATGGAVVDGKFYENDAALAVTIPTPAGATRKDLIVLRKDFALQTVRVYRIAGAEGGAVPTPVQTDGVTWDIPLCEASITTLGAITLTDRRIVCETPLKLGRVRGSISNPQVVYGQRPQIFLIRTDKDIIPKRIHISGNDNTPTSEMALDLKYADDTFTGSFAGATVIDVCDTTSGVFTSTSGFDVTYIPAGKYIYFSLDSSPHTDWKDFYFEFYYVIKP